MIGEQALTVLEGVTDLYVAKGQNVLHHDLRRARPQDDELLELILGRSGKLRAPTVRVGTRLLVGYNDELLTTLL